MPTCTGTGRFRVILTCGEANPSRGHIGLLLETQWNVDIDFRGNSMAWLLMAAQTSNPPRTMRTRPAVLV